MWKSVKILNKQYGFLSKKENNVYTISLTDFVTLWHEELTIETILQRCKALNPLLKIEALNIEKTIEEILSQIPEILDSAVEETNSYKIILYNNIKGGKLKFELNLNRGSNEEFYETITKSISTISMDLIDKYYLLLNIIKAKDEEIAEYKSEGAKLIRKNIETKPFNEDCLKIKEIKTEEGDECTFRTLFNMCNKAEELNFSNSEKVEIKTENKDEISVEMKIKEEETKEVSESNSFEQENVSSSLPTNNPSEENLKPKEEIKSPNAKRKIKRISASIIKPVKKAKSRVNTFLS
ncbi:non-homologous end-joining factor 1-like isoform X2 [Leptopilina heterotoma]|uniref:non-homologous end-joining factor 1-like isoform X2 n=1 Tax=Leptopilina heterotoma TaxID=63436 RepID=UPI001CA8C017|nr:non-homologous end-joining factor 1-like isoform X2 [Leptopilina heterotoma]